MNKNKLSEKITEKIANIMLALLVVMFFLALMVFIFPSELMLIMEIMMITAVMAGIMIIIEGICHYLKRKNKKQLVGHLFVAGVMFLLTVLFLLV